MECKQSPYVLITGSTGFVGHYVLAALLRRGVRCAVLLRPPVTESIERLSILLNDLGLDARQLIGSHQLVPLEGNLPDVLPTASLPRVTGVIHIAASTRFDTDATGEPTRTNITGTQRLLDWAGENEIRSFHLVSSAYQCGRVTVPVPETVLSWTPDFHNAYERTKWESEHLCVDWAARAGRLLTIYRPSVVVGAYGDGRATKFSGLYLSMRATEILSRSLDGASHSERWTLPLRLQGRPEDAQNIVPVDYVAAMIAAVYCNPADHGRVYHLTHPTPPTNQQIKDAIEAYFDCGGSQWVEPSDFQTADLNETERTFHNISRPIEHYFIDTPDFEHGQTDRIEQRTGITCQAYNPPSLTRLIRYAHTCQWGRKSIPALDLNRDTQAIAACAAYYERFLPDHVSQSQIAKSAAINTTVRFIIEDIPNGQWVCRFDMGQLVEVHRGSNALCEQIAYRTTLDAFWRAILGRVHPQELFLSGEAQIAGDIEQGLKLAMILHSFTREFPCDRQTLERMQAVDAQ